MTTTADRCCVGRTSTGGCFVASVPTRTPHHRLPCRPTLATPIATQQSRIRSVVAACGHSTLASRRPMPGHAQYEPNPSGRGRHQSDWEKHHQYGSREAARLAPPGRNRTCTRRLRRPPLAPSSCRGLRTPGGTRTLDPPLKRRLSLPLSYRRVVEGMKPADASRWRESNPLGPAYKAGAHPHARHRRRTAGGSRTRNEPGLSRPPLPLGHRGRWITDVASAGLEPALPG